MQIITKINILHKEITAFKRNKKTIGLIPTMGNLHHGHIQLILLAKKYVDVLIVSIFVNPTQFENILDLKKYPKTLQQDYKKLQQHNIDVIFSPCVNEMYPNGIKNITFVKVPRLSKILEGQLRPGHFQGVTTIISKLFNLIQPDYAFFGKKDYQQLLIIKILIQELNYMIKVISLPTIRLNNGLALSSRNNYLNIEEKKIAPYLYSIIQKASKELTKKKGSRKKIIDTCKNLLVKKGFLVEIFNIYDYKTLSAISKKNKKVILLASVILGKTRLIDNKTFFLIH